MHFSNYFALLLAASLAGTVAARAAVRRADDPPASNSTVPGVTPKYQSYSCSGDGCPFLNVPPDFSSDRGFMTRTNPLKANVNDPSVKNRLGSENWHQLLLYTGPWQFTADPSKKRYLKAKVSVEKGASAVYQEAMMIMGRNTHIEVRRPQRDASRTASNRVGSWTLKNTLLARSRGRS